MLASMRITVKRREAWWCDYITPEALTYMGITVKRREAWWCDHITLEPLTDQGSFSDGLSLFTSQNSPHTSKPDRNAAFFDQFALVEQYRWYAIVEAKKRRARRRR